MRNLFNLKPYLTFLGRNKVYTLITVFGFSVSLMFVILLGLHTQQEYNVDQWHKQGDRIYVFATETSDSSLLTMSTQGLGILLKKRYPEIEKTCGVTPMQNTRTNLLNGETMQLNYLYVEPTFFDFFDFGLSKGNRKHALDRGDAAIISRELAGKMFDDADPIGQTITYNDSLKLHVTGVFDRWEATSLERPDVIVSSEALRKIDERIIDTSLNVWGRSELYLMTRKGSNIMSKQADMTMFINGNCVFFNEPDRHVKAVLIPLKKLYMSAAEDGASTRANKKMVHLLFTMVLVVLVFAVINYVNLTVAQGTKRMREMAARRLFGAGKGEIVTRLVIESMAMCLVSFIIGLALAFALAPLAGKVLGTVINVAAIFRPLNLCVVVAFVLVVGLISGIIPALTISSAKPVDVLKGTFRHKTRMILGRVFIIVQNVVVIVMVGSSLIVLFQTRHLISAPLGYNTDNLIDIMIPNDSLKTETFKNELRKLSEVKLMSLCTGSPAKSTLTLNGQAGDEQKTFLLHAGDGNFLKILGVKVIQDYHTGRSEGAYVDRNFISAFNLKDKKDLGDILTYDLGNPRYRNYPILGVISDIRAGSITNEWTADKPTIVFQNRNPLSSSYRDIIVKIDGNPAKTYSKVCDVYRKVFKERLDEPHPFVDQKVQAFYENEVRMSAITSLFAFVAVIISIMGLVAMSTYFIDRSAQETAIRKVFGSTGQQVRMRLIRTFMTYVVIAFIIAVPVVWYFMSDWIMQYSYRISIWPSIIISGVLCFLISLAAVYMQCRNASNENPVQRLKDNG